jgi:O-acetyl-ADP-ribose deacetylase (regulator of RNase III)
LGGGGVNGAVHLAASPELLRERKTLGGCETGGAKITKGYRLAAKYVIHAVGPVWNGGQGDEPRKLADCYRRSLELAAENGARSVVFPRVSTGLYRFPKDRAAAIAYKTVLDCLEYLPGIEKVIFCCFSDTDYNIYRSLSSG